MFEIGSKLFENGHRWRWWKALPIWRYEEPRWRAAKYSSPIPSAPRLIARAGGGVRRHFPLSIRHAGEGRSDTTAQAHQRTAVQRTADFPPPVAHGEWAEMA